MNWNKKEIAYQHVHAWWGFWTVFFAYQIIGSVQALWLGLALGIAVEAWQVIGKHEKLWKLDRFRDVLFYVLGGVLAVLVF